MRDCKIKANTRVEWYELFGVRTQCDFPGKLRPWQRRWRRREIPRAERIGLHGNHPKANPGYIRTYIYPCRGASATLPLLRSLFINLLPFSPLSTLPYCPPSPHPELSFSLSPVICFTPPSCSLLFYFSLASLCSAIIFLPDFFFIFITILFLYRFVLFYVLFTPPLPSSFHFSAFTFLRRVPNQTSKKRVAYLPTPRNKKRGKLMNYTRSIKSMKRFCAEIQQISKSGVTTFARELDARERDIYLKFDLYIIT